MALSFKNLAVPDRVLPGILSCGVRTFLKRRPEGADRDHRPASALRIGAKAIKIQLWTLAAREMLVNSLVRQLISSFIKLPQDMGKARYF